MSMAIDCLAGYLFTCQKDGDVIPSPSPISSVSAEKGLQKLELPSCETFVSLISVDVDSYAKDHFEKSVKKLLQFPSG